MAFPIVALGGLVVDGIKGWFGHKKAKTEAKRAVQLQRITADASTDAQSAAGMNTSWKDEYLTLIFSAPMIIVFYAALIEDYATIFRVKYAFATLQELPEWYMWSIVGIVIGTFGLRTIAGLGKILPGK